MDSYIDSSGLRIYYQPAMVGVQDLGVFATGQFLLEIPPGNLPMFCTLFCLFKKSVFLLFNILTTLIH